MLVAIGLGMTVGTLLGGWAADHHLEWTLMIGFPIYIGSIAAGFGYRSPSWLGAILGVFGMALLILSFSLERRGGRKVLPVAPVETVSAFS